MALTLSGCTFGQITIGPDYYCKGEFSADDWRGKFDQALEQCIPMVRVTIEQPPTERE